MVNPTQLTAAWTSWTSCEEATVNSWEDTIAIIEGIASNADCPALIEFFDKNCGLSLGIGVGRLMTVITFQASLDPPYFISLGDEKREGMAWFCYGNERTEYLAKNLIPIGDAMVAVKYFIKNRARPENIEWEQL